MSGVWPKANGSERPVAESPRARLRARVAPRQFKDPSLPLSPAKAGAQVFLFVPFFVYILASQRNGTLYLGYTDDIFRRVTEHKSKSLGGFTAKHNVDLLVWYETHESREGAWTREHQMKKWRRAWKLEDMGTQYISRPQIAPPQQ